MSINIDSPKGTKVKGIFNDQGQIMHGYDFDQKRAMEYLKPNVVYTIDHTVIYDWRTNVYLEQFPNIPFNSVHFAYAESNSIRF